MKATKAFVWPKDGKNVTSWGRFKDILRNQGPDMYVTFNAEKHDYMHNRPTRATWSCQTTLDDRDVGNVYTFGSKKPAPWVKKGILAGGREWGKSYDFRTRKFDYPNRYTWSDAVWQTGPWKNKYNPYPEAVRNIYGQWFQDDHYLRQFGGGPVSNERGRGWPDEEVGRV